MSTRHPATVTLSFAELARHGGLVGPHRDGWGLAYYEGRDAHLFREAAPAATSPSLRFLQEHPFTATTVVGHIRRATQGPPALANSQPFVRELGGRAHVFAHNGDLAGLADGAPSATYQPIGDTDSERAFCGLLEQLRPLWQAARGVPALDARLAVIAAFAASLRPRGPANFVYADGDAIFAHAHRRNQGDARGVAPPGLHLLCRRCAGEPGAIAGLDLGAAPQDVVLVASVPLSDERWLPLAEGEVVALVAGTRVASVSADAVAPPLERTSR